jgi:hypothetical protein
MTVVISQNTTSDKSALLVQKAAQVTALAAITNPNNSQVQLLEQTRRELVIGALDTRRLDPATVISTMGVNTSIDPAVGQLITKLSTQVGGAADDLLRSARIQAIHNALAKGQISAVNVLSTMS